VAAPFIDGKILLFNQGCIMNAPILSTILDATQRSSYYAPWHAIHLDNHGIITFANSHVSARLQQPLSTLIGQPLSNYISIADAPDSLSESIFATRYNNTYFETTCQLICNHVTEYYDIFARHISDNDTFVFIFTPHIDVLKSSYIATCVQQFANDTLTESNIDTVFTVLQNQLAKANIGVFSLLLQQPIYIAAQNTTLPVDFTGLWIFGHRIPTDVFASLSELNFFLTSQSNNSTTIQRDPITFGELPLELNDLLTKRFSASGLRLCHDFFTSKCAIHRYYWVV
jgi:hypothetical protein